MNKNLQKRITTSLILLIILLFVFFTSKYVFLMSVIIISLVLYIEAENLILKIYPKKKNYKIYSSVFFYLLLLIYCSYFLYDKYLLFIILACICSDTGGFVIGKIIGGKKLTKISPNKTIAGSIGSFIFSIIFMIYFLTNHSSIITDIPNFFKNNFFYDILLLTFLITFLCQLGDLIISYFKRLANVKDTGKILPGHGGLLDRIDGIIFVIPIIFLIDYLF